METACGAPITRIIGTISLIGHNGQVTPPRPAASRRGPGAIIVALALLLSMLTAAPAAAVEPAAPVGNAAVGDVAAAGVVRTADLSKFNPGSIISDAVFFDSSTMSEAQIDKFLRSKVSSCRAGYTCLKDFRQNTTTRAADTYCRGGYQGGNNESAARIIYKVSQGCGINPQVLLATLEKEQSLVSHTWPSEYRYRAAMGQGCPDTAACDTRYYGFQNQVYGAARQFQIYAEGKHFTWYAPGKTWNILYNPNRDCGSSPVRIQNTATAALYYYTPYQPNAAALRAGYGTGDGCSSYGNRNFYNFFTDWFGSTQTAAPKLVRIASDPAVWIVSDGWRWHITQYADYEQLARVLGAAVVVADSFLNTHAVGGQAGAVIRNSATGVIALVQDGKTHRLSSCADVAIWGGSCSAPVNVSAKTFDSVPAGDEAGRLFKVKGKKQWGRFEDVATAAPFHDEAAVRAAAGTPKKTPYTPWISPERWASLTKTAPYYAPGRLVKTNGDAKVWMLLDFDKRVWVTNMAEVAEYGLTASQVIKVTSDGLVRYRDAGTMKPTLTCDGATYFPAGGTLYKLPKPETAGLSTMAATAVTCAQFPSAKASDMLAVKTASSSDVFVVQSGKRRHALAWDVLVTANGGRAPQILTLKPATLAAVPVGVPMAKGLVVKAADAAPLYLVGADKLHWVPSFGIASDLGLGLAFQTFPSKTVSAIPRGQDLGIWVRCDKTTYLGAGGKLWPLTGAASKGVSAVQIAMASTCKSLQIQSEVQHRVYLKSVAAAEVYLVENGKARWVPTWDKLLASNGGSVPRIHTVSAEGFAGVAKGDPLG